MNYQETIDYLFNAAPLFQNIGAGAYKEGLANTHALDNHFGHPHTSYRTIHVAGTNGKGSTCHTLAAILQSAGYKVGLYTSPHLIDFRERIRVNGEMISKERVIEFVEKERTFFEPLHPSFFELATALAFLYFREQKVDVAIIEVGLGGRLDCTNIIHPDLSVITNISFDHTQFLGNTLPLIATEKAGIIKKGVPVVIGETNEHADVKQVFIDNALNASAPVFFAEELGEDLKDYPRELQGDCQEANQRTILCAIRQLQKRGYKIEEMDIKRGFMNVTLLTGLMGRWQVMQQEPLVICDAGHNTGGLCYTKEQLARIMHLRPHAMLRMVIGMVGDKDVEGSLALLPTKALYYFTQASVSRAMGADHIRELGRRQGLDGTAYATVKEAYCAALREAAPEDVIFVGGSCFVVADFLAGLTKV
ncbi:MAG: bifunctional folylpolyglutamate synthase/dihydrofolate synthase [Bacteroidales bacterium]|nr:bifunctional folylpolyglutamate synthase/dihydrofolate synthase [Candidatus Physcousia equi]